MTRLGRQGDKRAPRVSRLAVGANEVAPSREDKKWRRGTRPALQLFPGDAIADVRLEQAVRIAGRLHWLCQRDCGHAQTIEHSFLSYGMVPPCADCAAPAWQKSVGVGESDAAFAAWLDSTSFAKKCRNRKPLQEGDTSAKDQL